MKKILFLLLLLLVGGSLFFFFPKKNPAVDLKQAGWKQFSSTQLDFTFLYPPQYLILENAVTEPTQIYKTLTLIEDTADNRLFLEGKGGVREGPTAMVIAIYPNAKQTPLVEWLEQTPSANKKLASKEPKAFTFARQSGYTYTWSGLYEGRTIAIPYKNTVVTLSVTSLNEKDAIVSDFENLLTTFTFTTK